MINDQQQFVSSETTRDLNAAEILDRVQVPDGHQVAVALVGWDTSINDYNGLFLHFSPLPPSSLYNFVRWGSLADVLVEFYDSGIRDALVNEVRLRWPKVDIYDYGCMCCNTEPMYVYAR